MKRFLILAAVVLTSVRCTHSYEEGMSGSFPFIELMSSSELVFDAQGSESSLTGTILIHTNMDLSASVSYLEFDGNWVNEVRIESMGNETSVYVQLSPNTLRSSRAAIVNILADNQPTGLEVYVRQNAFEMNGVTNVHDGDLYISSQSDADNCIYTDIEGRLILGQTNSSSYYWRALSDNRLFFTDNDIQSLAGLEFIQRVEGGFVAGGLSYLDAMWDFPQGLTFPLVEFVGCNPNLLYSFECVTDELYISECSQFYSLEFLNAIHGVKKLYMQNNFVSDLYGIGSASELQELHFVRNSCSGDISQLAPLSHLALLDLSENAFERIDGIAMLSGLETLDLSGNNIGNINELADMKWLKSLDISSLPISRYQANYVSESLPGTVVKASNPTSDNVSLSLSPTVLDSDRAQLSVSISGMYSGFEAGVVLVKGTEFDFSARQLVESIYTNGQFTLDVPGLESGTTYTAWLYTIDGNGRIYLSDRASFTTNTEIIYKYTFTANIPSYDNTAQSGTIGSIRGLRLYNNNSTLMTENVNPVAGMGSSYSFSTNEGQCDLMLYGLGTGSNTVQIEYSYGDTGALWAISSENAAGGQGLGTDIVVAATSEVLETDVVKDIDFIRPVAQVAITAEFENLETVAAVTSIQMTMDNMYGKYTFGSGQSGTYSGTSTCSFSAVTTSGSTIQTLVPGAYVFPNISSGTSSAEVVLTLSDGSRNMIQTKLPEHISANNQYNINIAIAYNRTTGSFTVEEIEVVEDVIEF